MRRVLERLCEFFKLDPKQFLLNPDKVAEEEANNLDYKYPVIWGNTNEKPLEMDGLDNLVDTTDGFLMLAFEDYFFEKPEETENPVPSLFEQ